MQVLTTTVENITDVIFRDDGSEEGLSNYSAFPHLEYEQRTLNLEFDSTEQAYHYLENSTFACITSITGTTSDIIIEADMKSNADDGGVQLAYAQSPGNGFFYGNSNVRLRWEGHKYANNSWTSTLNATGTSTKGSWYHVELVKSGTSITVNCYDCNKTILYASTTQTYSDDENYFGIGGEYFKNIIVRKPPVTSYANANGHYDINWTGTQILLENGSNGSLAYNVNDNAFRLSNVDTRTKLFPITSLENCQSFIIEADVQMDSTTDVRKGIGFGFSRGTGDGETFLLYENEFNSYGSSYFRYSNSTYYTGGTVSINSIGSWVHIKMIVDGLDVEFSIIDSNNNEIVRKAVLPTEYNTRQVGIVIAQSNGLTHRMKNIEIKPNEITAILGDELRLTTLYSTNANQKLRLMWLKNLSLDDETKTPNELLSDNRVLSYVQTRGTDLSIFETEITITKEEKDIKTITPIFIRNDGLSTLLNTPIQDLRSEINSYLGNSYYLNIIVEDYDGLKYLHSMWNNTFKMDIIDMIYPIGSIYMSVYDISPETLFGGAWEQLKDRFLLGSGDTYANGSTGGSATVTLTSAQSGVPAHSHKYNDYNTTYTLKTTNRKPGTSTAVAYGTSLTAGGGATERTSSNNTAANASQAHENMPPYMAVYMWKRTS